MGLPASVDPRDPVSLAQYYENHSIPVQYNAGFIVLSIIVSLIGCYTTLLLIGRRTGNAGWRNILFLVLAATTTSSVGIWGMHFIGMHLQLKPSEDVTWYVHFAPGFTVFSLFLPLVILCFAFYFLGGQSQVDYLRIVICGISFGGIVSLMHYSASFQASFKATYDAVNLAFSIIISCVASSAALLAFFRFRERWQDVWWKRLLCGGLLAASVCAMHYIALVGTHWKVRSGHSYSDSWTHDRNSRLGYAIAGMCIALCLLSACLAVYDTLARKSSRLVGQQLVVASASFTRDGKILVKPDGSLPMQVMDTRASMHEIMRELDIRSNTFSWLYSLTWDWSILEPFLPRIVARIASLQALSDVDYTGVESVKEAFVLATQGLANELHLPITKVGVLFDKSVTTSTTTAASDPARTRNNRDKRDDRSSTTSVIENGFIRTPAGVMLVLVRELPDEGNDSAARYLSNGFRLSEPRFLAPMLCDRLGVDRDLMMETLEQLRCYARRGIRSVVQPEGVYASLFAVRPAQVRDGSDEVLVYNFARHQIPAFRLPEVASMSDLMRDWVKTCQSMTLESAMAHARTAAYFPKTGDSQVDQLRQFQKSFVMACEAILEATRIWPGLAALAKINTEVIDVPSSVEDQGCAHMIVFNVVLPEPLMPHERMALSEEKAMYLPQVHNSIVSIADNINDKERPFVFSPLKFFQTAQAMLFQGPQSQSFAQQARAQLNSWYPCSLAAAPLPTRYEEEKYFVEEKNQSSPSLEIAGSAKPSFINPFSTPGSTVVRPTIPEYQLSYDALPLSEKERSNSGSSGESDADLAPQAEVPMVSPPRPAKSPKRSSRRPLPPSFDDVPAVPQQMPADQEQASGQQQRPRSAPTAVVRQASQRTARPQPPSPPPMMEANSPVASPTPAYQPAGRRLTEASTATATTELSSLWGPALLTPREQARILRLHESALARQMNDGWAQRALSDLLPESARHGPVDQ